MDSATVRNLFGFGCGIGVSNSVLDFQETNAAEQPVDVSFAVQVVILQDPFADAPANEGEQTEDPFGDAAPAAPLPAAPVVDEFKFTREWNMQFRERCEAKDKAALEKKQEILKEARGALLAWNEEREKKLHAKAEMNREEEAKVIEGNKEDLNCANPWERVNKLIELNAEGEHDLSRMKQVLIRMKNDAAKM